jgi:hypothetical protein
MMLLEGSLMAPIRFRIRTIMIAIAALGVVTAVVRFILWAHSVFGFRLLFSTFAAAAVSVFLPVATIVEISFFFYLLLRRRPAGRTLSTDRHANWKPRRSGESMKP